jgi:hypothetical protein
MSSDEYHESEVLQRASARIERGKFLYGDRIIYSADTMLIIELVAEIHRLREAIEWLREES